MQEVVTILMTVSRSDFLQPVFSSLEMLECHRDYTNLVVIVDGDQDLFLETRNFVATSKFSQVLCTKYSKSGEVSNDIFLRRERIADIHNELKTHIGECKYVMGVEDDTIIPPLALKNLLEDYAMHPHAGFIQGVELGRHGDTYIGAWFADDVYEPILIMSVMPPDDKNIEYLRYIDAGGMYCFMSRRDIYINHEFKTFEDNGMGPDADYGMSLRQLGFSNFIDWRIECVHKSKDGDISLANSKPTQISFRKRNKTWSYYK